MEENNGKLRDLNLKAFDLGVTGGGMQLIIADKPVSENEHYVFTLGNAPKDRMQPKEPEGQEANGLKKAFMSFRDNILKKKPNEAEAEDDVKLRCFRLTWDKEKQLKAEEYVTIEGIVKVAEMFDFNKEV
jgi:hypothetical protein